MNKESQLQWKLRNTEKYKMKKISAPSKLEAQMFWQNKKTLIDAWKKFTNNWINMTIKKVKKWKLIVLSALISWLKAAFFLADIGSVFNVWDKTWNIAIVAHSVELKFQNTIKVNTTELLLMMILKSLSKSFSEFNMNNKFISTS